ncbi:MAG: hypothetical protein Q4F66_12340 [Clostridium sp.]|nr:hypothetical protein [Clostridium sp.]
MNKFHNFKFETDAEKDLEENAPKLDTRLSSENIGDDCSNERLLQYRYAANAQEKDLNKGD